MAVMGKRNLVNRVLQPALWALLGTIAVGAFTGCATAGKASQGAGESILEYQRKAALLEARIALYEGAVGDAIGELGDITVRAGNIDGTIDELISLFDEYQRGVNELLRVYRAAREESESAWTDSAGAGDSVWSDDPGEDSGIYPVRIRD